MPRPEARIDASPEVQKLRRSAVQPLFGDAVSAQRLIEGAPRPAGLGGGDFRPEFEMPTRVFSEEEMKVIRAVRSPAKTGRAVAREAPTLIFSPSKFQSIKMEISLCGQHKGLKGEGAPTRKGAFRYPLFGDSMYIGALVEGRRHGFGKQISAAGVYAGEFKEGLHDGFGVREYVDGGRYEGEWLGGYKHGRGTLLHPDGEKYQGDFARGRVHGVGEAEARNGDRYAGEWDASDMHGQGRYAWKAGTAVYRGVLHRNVIHGVGALEWTDEAGVRCEYEGGFAHGVLEGEGCMKLSSGAAYEGSFHEGMMHGRGVYTWPDGARFEGDFREGRIEGHGSFTGGLSDEAYGCDETHTGEWVGGRRHGPGVTRVRDRFTDGFEVLEGTWVGGVRHGHFCRAYAWGARTIEVYEAGERTAWTEQDPRSSPQK